MKKQITTLFLTLATAMGFAQATPEQTLTNVVVTEVNQPRATLEVKVAPKRSFTYLKMGIADSQLPKDTGDILPGVGLGYRLVSGSSALDFSASGTMRDISTAFGTERTYVYTLPKVDYLYYLSSNKNNSLYAGAGLAVAGVRTSADNEFHGLGANAVVGYEMNRSGTLRSFMQFDVSQALLAASQKGALPKPYGEFSLGVGF